jgi:hypothetical protein
MTALLAVVCLFCRLAADLSPEIDGKALEVAIEVQCPEGFQIPEKLDDYGAFAGVYVPNGRNQPTGKLGLEEAKSIDGRLMVTAVVPLGTSSRQKFMRVYFTKAADLLFSLPLRSRPNRNDFAWSKWVESGWEVGQPEPAPGQKFRMRFRVQAIEPPPPGPTHEEIVAKEAAEEQATFDAIPKDAPIATWLPYTRYGAREDRLRIAVERIVARPDYVAELGELMVSPEQEVASDALRLVLHVPQPPAELVSVVADAGRQIVALIRKGNEITPAQDESYLWAADVSVRFSAWMEAVRTLREKSGGDFTPILGEILVLSRVREDSHCMAVDVRRVASYYMQQWAGLQPLAGDPKPR